MSFRRLMLDILMFQVQTKMRTDKKRHNQKMIICDLRYDTLGGGHVDNKQYVKKVLLTKMRTEMIVKKMETVKP